MPPISRFLLPLLLLAAGSLSAQNTGSALFDGQGDRIRIIDGAPANPQAVPSAYAIAGNITVEAWVFTFDLPGPNAGRFIAARLNESLADPFHTYALKIDNYDGNGPRFAFTVSDGVTPIPANAYVADTAVAQPGRWYHVAGTYDGSVVRLYIDGVKVNETTKSVTMGTAGVGFYIGGTIFDYFRGAIDEVRLWNVVRSEAEIQGAMNSTLSGGESGLAGYWPLDSTYLVGGAPVSPDKSPSKNDLRVQFDARIAPYPFGSAVQVAPTNVTAHNYAINTAQYLRPIISDGYPTPTYTLVSGPSGLAIAGTDLTWLPGTADYGSKQVVIDAVNAAGSIRDTFFVYLEGLDTLQNAMTLAFTNRGKFGAFAQYGKGMYFGGLNGLYSADFSLVDKNDFKYAGGLFTSTNSFAPTSSFSSIGARFPGFTPRSTTFDDSFESNPIGVNVQQIVHWATGAPDDRYAIVEYKITNRSGGTIDSVFAQITADMDVGASGNNSGNYDAALRLMYAYEIGGATNGNYYGVQVLSHTVSGQAVWIGGDAAFVRNVNGVTQFVAAPTVPGDIREQVSVGPLSVDPSDTATVVFAFLAAPDLESLRDAAQRARRVYLEATSASALPVIAEIETNNTSASATAGGPGVILEGGLESTSDVDYYSFFATAGDTIQFEGLPLTASALQYRVEVFDNAGSQLYGSHWYRTSNLPPYGAVVIQSTGTHYLRILSYFNYTTSFPNKQHPRLTPEQMQSNGRTRSLSREFRMGAVNDTGSYRVKFTYRQPGLPMIGYTYLQTSTSSSLGLGVVGFSNGSATTVTIDYGPTPALGLEASSAGYPAHSFWATGTTVKIQGFKGGEVLYYRVRLTNAYGEAYGPTLSLTTPSHSTHWAEHVAEAWEGAGLGYWEPRMDMVDGLTMYVSAGDVLRTTNGGLSWTNVSPSPSYYHYSLDVIFSDARNGFSIGGGTEPIVATSDSGMTWTPRVSGTYYELARVSTFDHIRYVASSYNGDLLLSSDGGLTWIPAQLPVSGWGYAITHTASSTVLAVSVDGNVYRSTSGGQTGTWSQIGTGLGYNTYSIKAISPNTLLAAVGDGISRSTDGGVTWSSVLSSSVRMWEIAMQDSVRGYAVGNEGTIVRTTDAGLTWVPEESGTGSLLSDVGVAGGNAAALGTFGIMPFRGVSAEQEDNSTAGQANRIAYNDTVRAVIDPNSDVDYFSFQSVAGDTVRIQAQNRAGSVLDGHLQVFDEGGNVVASNDDFRRTGGQENNSVVVFVVPATGKYYARFAWVGTGGAFPNKTLGGKTPESIQPSPQKSKTLDSTWTYQLTIHRIGPRQPEAVEYFRSGIFFDRFKSVINVIPYGLPTTVTVDYGTSPGSLTSSVQVVEGAVSDVGVTTVNANITGLTASTTYYYRISATNSIGTYLTPVDSITMPAAPDGWTLSNIGTESALSDVSFLSDHNTGIIVGFDGFAARTFDGGNTWSPMNLNLPSSAVILYGVKFFENGSAIAVGTSNIIRRTTDFGNSWSDVFPPVATSWRDLVFVDQTRGLISGNNGFVLRTFDAGQTWTQTSTIPGMGIVWGVHSFDMNKIVAVGTDGTIAVSYDAGATWTSSVVDGGLRWFLGVAFQDNARGVAVGDQGMAYRTLDGGVTWMPVTVGTSSTLRKVTHVAGGEYWAASFDGSMYRSLDGGASWTPVSVGGLNPLRGVRTITSDHIVGVGSLGMFYERDVRPARLTLFVDMANAIKLGKFKPGRDSVAVRGSRAPFSWAASSQAMVLNYDSVYLATFDFAEPGPVDYKFVIHHGNEFYWELQRPGLPNSGNRTTNLSPGITTISYWFDNLTSPYVPAPGEYPMTPSVMSMWRLDEDPIQNPTFGAGNAEVMFDRGDIGFHGLNNGATHVQGRTRWARSFDGVDDRVEIGTDVLQLTRDSSFTVEGWVYLTQYPASSGYVFFNGGSPEMFLGVRNTGKLTTGIRRNDNVLITDSSGVQIPLNRWVHLAVSYDGVTKSFVNSVNGIRSTATSLGVGFQFLVTAPYAVIGKGRDSTNHFKGSIDEVRITRGVVQPAAFNLRLSPPGLATISRSRRVNLTWNEPAGSIGLLGYKIYRGLTPATLVAIDSIIVAAGTSYADTTVVDGATYHYRVTAVDVTGTESAPSILATGTPLPPPQPVAVAPVRNSWNADTSTTVTTTFNTGLSSGASTPVFIRGSLSGRKVLDSVRYNPASLNLQAFPRGFQPGERVEAVVTRGAVNLNGDSASTGFSYRFHARSYSGTGVLTQSTTVSPGEATTHAVAGDIDGDGDVDIITSNFSSNTVSVFKNTGPASFSLHATLSGLVNPAGVALVPVAGKGFALAVHEYGLNRVSVYSNDGSGNFSLPASYGIGSGPSGIAVADVDGDGHADLVNSCYGSNEVWVLRGNSFGAFVQGSILSTTTPEGLALADIDLDGRVDIIASNGPQTYLTMFRNTGSGFAFHAQVNLPASVGNHLEASDLDANGTIDIVAGLTSADVAIVRLNASGDYVTTDLVTVGNNMYGTRLADMNGDGRPDIVVASIQLNQVHVLLQQSGGSFVESSSPATGTSPRLVLTSDFDRDGDIDIVTGHQSSADLYVFRNNYDTNPPSAPTNLSASAQSGSVTLTWTSGGESDLLRHRIFRGTSPNPATQVDSVAAGTNSYVDGGVTDSTVYYYRVIAVDQSFNASGYSAGVATVPHALATGEYARDTSTVLLVHFPERTGSTVVDASTRHYTGTATGTTIAAGRFGSGRSFNGTTDAITYSSSVIPSSGEYTVEAWVYGISAAGFREILSQGGSTNNFYIGYDASGLIRISDDWLATGVAFPFGGWHHIAVVRSASNTQLYIDGALRASLGRALLNVGTGGTLSIGQQFGGGEHWSGLIDEVRVSTIARSPSAFNLQRTPVAVAASPSGTTINLSWQNGGGAVGLLRYRVYRGADSTSLALIDSTTLTSYADVELASATQYFYRVTAVDLSGFESPRSIAAFATTSAAPNQALVTTYAGDGSIGFVDGSGTGASFNGPAGMARDNDGNIYIADQGNHAIRKMTQTGVVTTFAGNGTAGTTDGIGSAARFNTPFGVAVDAAGNLYVSEWANHVIRKVTPAGQTSVFAGSMGSTGSTDGTGGSARFNFPAGITIDASGNLYVADYGNNKIRRVSTTGLVTTVAGSGTAGFLDGLASTARFNGPVDVAVDVTGNVFVADEQNHRIRKITSAGTVSTLAGSTQGYVNATGTAARFSQPEGIAIDPFGNLFVTEISNHTVRKVTSAGVVTTVAGDTVAGWVDDLGTSARFNQPVGVLADGAGILFVSEDANSDIRRIIINYVPTAVTGTATSVTATGATLNGVVVPNGLSASSYFEYGTTTSYGSVTTTEALGFGTSGLALSAALTGLSPNTTYNFRIVATNSDGTTFGSNRTFTTLLPVPGVPSPASPDSGSTGVSLPALLVWRSGTNATSYQLQVSTSAAFSSTVLDTSGVTDTSFAVAGLANDIQYYWRVRSVNVSGTSSYANTWTFRTVIAAPPSPVLVSPSDNATNQPIAPQFVWNAAARAQTYHLQVSASNTFGILTFEDSTLTDTTASISGLTNNAVYYWRVRAKNAGGTSAYAATRQFTTIIALPAVPVLSAPADSATQQATTLALSWSAAARASTYRVQVATDTGFTAIVRDSSGIASTSYTASGLGNGITYHWRVLATNAAGSSAYSARRRFTTIISIPDVPVLNAPADAAANQLTTLAINWRSAARASSYHLQVSTSNVFATFFVNDSTLTDTSYTATPLANSSTYYWRVRSRNVAGSSAFTAARSFTTVPAIPEVPTLSSPADLAVDQALTLTLTWATAAGAATYRLEVSTDSLFGSFAFVDSTITATSRGVGPLASSTTYFWRVRAQNPGGNSAFSAFRRFTTVLQVPAVPVLVSPDSNATGQPATLTLRWRTAERASSYRLQVSRTSNFSALVSDQQGLTDTSFSVGPLDNDSTYYWRVSATNIGGTSGYSNVWTFRTIIAPPAAPSLASPNDNATNQPVTLSLSWNSTARASTYRLEVATSNTFATLTFVDSTLAATTRQITLAYNTQYYWRVRAENAGGAGPYSTIRNFTTIIESPARPVLVGPDSAMTGQPLTVPFVWRSAARAATYRVQVAQSATFTITVADVQNVTDTSLAVGPLQYNTEYFWRVSATNAGGTSAYSNTWRLTTIIEQPATPTLLTPSDAASNQQPSLQFAWNAAARATSYRLQIATDPGFATVVEDIGGISQTTHLVSTLQYQTTYYWRVRAENAGGASAYSGARQFTTVVAPVATAPALTAPADNATNVVQGTTFQWGSVAGATTYHLQISSSNQFSSFIENDSLLTGTSKSVSTLTFNATLFWRVRGKNAGGAGPWSSVRTFTTVPPLPIALLNPSPVNFGTIEAGFEMQDRVVTLSNGGGANLNVSSVTMAGPDASSFTIQSGGGAFTVTPGSQRQVTVRFNASTTGQKTAYLQFATNDQSQSPSGLVSDTLNGFAADNTPPYNANLSVSVSPSTWTSMRDFTVSWTPQLTDISGVTRAFSTFNTPPTAGSPGQPVSITGGNAIVLTAPAQGTTTAYFYFEDGAGNKDPNLRYSVTLRWDNTAPVIVHDTTVIPEVVITNGIPAPAVTISATVTDQGGSSLTSSRVEYRRSGEASFQSAALPDVQIPAAMFLTTGNAPSGVEYRIVALDGAGNRTATKVYSIRVRTAIAEPPPPPPTPHVGVAGLPPGSDEINAYRIFSVPYDLDDKRPQSHMEQSFGPHQEGSTSYARWRFQRYTAGVREDFEAFKGANALTPGAGFFFIIREAGKKFTPQTGARIVNAQEMNDNGVAVSAGWNLIGNPLNAVVPYESLQVRSGTKMQVAYFTGTGGVSGWETSGSNVAAVRPWEGLAIRFSESTRLLYRTIGSQPGIADPERPEQPLFAQRTLAAGSTTGGWTMSVDAVRDDNGRKDVNNVYGMVEGASDGIDAYDRFQPPYIGYRNVALYFENEADPLFEDIRSVNPTGGIWEMRVRTGDEGARVRLTLRGADLLPDPSAEAFLIDLDQRMAYNLRTTERVDVNSGTGLRKFRIVVGTRAFVAGNSGGVDLYPKEYVLHANYPNPFNPETIIRYTVADRTLRAHVTLRVYDVLGREVVTLVDGPQGPGYYEVPFRATAMSSGAYFTRLQIADEHGQPVFSGIRRMVFVK